MSKSSIEWTDEVWNPVTGCTRASAGCDNCYAVRMSYRLENMGQEDYKGLTVVNGKGDRHFNGIVRCHEDRLTIPLRWRKARRCFVNSMSDLFHKDVPFDFIDKVFAVMAITPHITYQVLTKRPERMAEYFADEAGRSSGWRVAVQLEKWNRGFQAGKIQWPLPNVWLGTSVEDQQTADERVPLLLHVPAAVRFLSCEPLLGRVDLRELPVPWRALSDDDIGKPFTFNALCRDDDNDLYHSENHIDWVICGGESGPKARPMHPEWARALRDQCQTAGVPFHFKQWGEWAPVRETHNVVSDDQLGKVQGYTVVSSTDRNSIGKQGFYAFPTTRRENANSQYAGQFSSFEVLDRVGKHTAGRLLDGRTHDEFPEVLRG